jgi:hypothetical protein
LKVSIYQASEAKKLLDFHLLRLEVEMVQKTYNMTIMLRIGGISLVHFDPVASVCLLDTPMAAGDSKYLFTLVYVDVSSNSSMVDSKLKSVRITGFWILSIVQYSKILVNTRFLKPDLCPSLAGGIKMPTLFCPLNNHWTTHISQYQPDTDVVSCEKFLHKGSSVRRTIPMVEKPFYFPPPPISPDVFI